MPDTEIRTGPLIMEEVDHGILHRRTDHESQNVVLFVHGVRGSPTGTWRKFPDHLIAEEGLRLCDLAHFRYPMGVLVENKTIQSIGLVLKGWMEQHLSGYSHIFILAHSLGGLLTRFALHEARRDSNEESQRLWRRIRAVFLFAVPHRGSWLATILGYIPMFAFHRMVGQLKGNSAPTEILRSLNKMLPSRNELARQEAPSFKVIYGTGDWVVPKESATDTGAEEYLIAVEGDHVSITKPESPTATVVRVVTNEIRRHVLMVPVVRYQRKIIQLFHEQPIAQSFVPPGASSAEGSQIDDLLQELKCTIKDNNDAFVLVLGDYGSGKTSLCYQLARDLAVEALSDPSKPILPLYLNLGHARSSKSIVEAISTFVSRYRIRLDTSTLLQIMNDEPNLVFILDGFDEMANRSEWSAVPEILDKIEELRVASGIRIVLTSRTTFFREKLDERLVPATHRYYISPFDADRMAAYLSKTNFDNPDAFWSLVKGTSLYDLCQSPIHLHLCTHYVANNPDASANTQPVDIYSSFVDENLVRNATSTPHWPLSQRRALVQRIAYKWFSEDVPEVNLEEFDNNLAEFLPHITPEDRSSRAMQLLNCSFFMRVVDQYRFFHFSFLEFFAAETLVADLFEGDLEKWSKRPLYAELFDFMSQLIVQREDPLPIDRVVDCDNEIAQSNFLATMYRQPIEKVWTCYARLVRSSHELVRCVATAGLGLSQSEESADALIEAAIAEENTVLKSILTCIASKLVGDMRLNKSLPPPPPELLREDAEQVLKTHRDQHSITAFRKALLLGDKRWTSTVAAIYLLFTIHDDSSFDHIRSLGEKSVNSAIRAAVDDFSNRSRTPTAWVSSDAVS